VVTPLEPPTWGRESRLPGLPNLGRESVERVGVWMALPGNMLGFCAVRFVPAYRMAVGGGWVDG
jgi:hypothetical protein